MSAARRSLIHPAIYRTSDSDTLRVDNNLFFEIFGQPQNGAIARYEYAIADRFLYETAETRKT